jgi:hypothetical protein
MLRKFAVVLIVLALTVAILPTAVFGQGVTGGQPEVSQAVKHDVSLPLRDMQAAASAAANYSAKPLRLIGPANNINSSSVDAALQTSGGPSVGTTPGLSFAGVGNGDYGFAPNAAPPDTEGTVGATQYVQWVNESFAVFDKSTGALVLGPLAGNTLWSGFGGGCQTNNDGDPIVQYDKLANRWIFTQFSVSTTPYLQCVAVSTTSDATGTYNRYSFNYGTPVPRLSEAGGLAGRLLHQLQHLQQWHHVCRRQGLRV